MPVSPTIRRILSVYPLELPVFHPIALKLLQVTQNNDFTIDDILSLACKDQLLVSKILRAANSPAYRGSAPVETMKDAVVRLGAQPVANIAMAASHASLHVSDNDTLHRMMRKLWQHSHACALGCSWVAVNVGLKRMADQAYLAGLLHDIGKLYLLKILEKLTNSGVACSALEHRTMRDVFTELHVDEGSKLISHWGLPDIYRKVVEGHHDQECNVEDLVLIIVRLVNGVCRKVGASLNPDPLFDVAKTKEVTLLCLDSDKLSQLEHLVDEARSFVI